MTAHNWRALRQRSLGEGVADLMALPSLHAVLDLMETFGAEASVQGCKTETEGKAKLAGFYDRLYKPDMSEIARMVNGSDADLLKPPPGFEDDEVEASFDTFLSAVNGR